MPLAPGFFRGRVVPVTYKLAFQWLPCQASGVIGSALVLVGPVSVYCDWVRWKVWSATSISVWRHIKLSVQIHPWDTLACCWDVKQPTNNNQCRQDERCPEKYKGIALFLFLKPKRRLEDCKAWIKACARLHDQILDQHTWSALARPLLS